jgi:hypothetical protein
MTIKKHIRKKLFQLLFGNEIEIGDDTVKIDGNSVTLPGLTSNPTLEAGKIWFRSDTGTIHYTPDGTNTMNITPADWNTIVNKPSTYPPSTHGNTHGYNGSDAIPNGEIAPAQLLVSEDNLMWEMIKGEALFIFNPASMDGGICFPTTYADKAVRGILRVIYSTGFTDYRNYLVARVGYSGEPLADNYHVVLDASASASDNRLFKHDASVPSSTQIGSEAVDLTAGLFYDMRLSCSGSTIKVYRVDMTTPKISVTDTFRTDGKWGVMTNYGTVSDLYWTVRLEAAASPQPKTIGIYEVPIIGSGEIDDPYRPQLPEHLEIPSANELDGYDKTLRKAIKHNRDGKVNRIAVSWGALIPTHPITGAPLNPTCIVRVFEQPDRQPHMWKISEALDEIEKAENVKKLDVQQAKKRALEMDKKLKEKDLDEW